MLWERMSISAILLDIVCEINIFVNNGTAVKRDVELVKWFVQDMKHLFNDDRVEILIDNKDLGVFEQ